MSTPTTRDHNKADVLGVVLRTGAATRNQVIEETGLSKATVSRAVEELLTDGFLVETGADPGSGRGRPSVGLDVPRACGHVVGVSFGVRTTSVLATDLRGRELGYVTVPTVVSDTLPAAAAWLTSLVDDLDIGDAGPRVRVVVAMSARVRDGREVIGPAEPMRPFAGPALAIELERLLTTRVILDSDANLSLLDLISDDGSIRNAVLFSVSSVLNVAGCVEGRIVRGRTAAFGDIGILASGVPARTLGDVLSTGGILALATAHGSPAETIEDLTDGRVDVPAAVEEALVTALVTAISTAAVTIDPEEVYLVGRLQPLVEPVLDRVRARLDTLLAATPRLVALPGTIGRSTTRGAIRAALVDSHHQLREVVLTARQVTRGEPRRPDWRPAPTTTAAAAPVV